MRGASPGDGTLRLMIWRITVLVAAALVAASGIAEAAGPTCGFDCSDGVYTACNDSFPTNMAGATANCSASLGSCTGEAFCASFGDNFQASAFPLTIDRIYLVAASNNAMDAAMQFDLEIYQELGNPQPGPQIGNTLNLAIAGSQTAATVVDFTNLGLQAPQIPVPGRFRICFRKQFDAGHNICLDDFNAPSAYGRNWAEVRIAADPNNPCGPAIVPNTWYSADGTGSFGFPGIMGDFIVRPDITAADPAGLPGGGACPGEDAGVPDDAGIGPVDGGPEPDGGPDAGMDAAMDGGPPDAGVPEAGPMDAMVAPDAADPNDAGDPDDAGLDPKDAGDEQADAGTLPGVDAGVLPAPEITAISPDEGRTDSPTKITVTGRGFVSGVELKIGAIAAQDVTLGGATTLGATVPQGIAAGVYDVVVTNPDGQAAILSDGFTIVGSSGGSPDEGCGCTGTGPEPASAPGSFLLLLGLVSWRIGARRRPRARD